MLWISSFYFFFGLETNLATKNVDKNFQILYKPLPWLGENHIKVAAKGQTEAHKHLPHLPRCGFWILQLSENPMGFWRKIEIPPSWNKHVHSWRMIEVASEQIWIAKSWARRNFQILIFFVSQSCKVKGKQIRFFPNITLFLGSQSYFGEATLVLIFKDPQAAWRPAPKPAATNQKFSNNKSSAELVINISVWRPCFFAKQTSAQNPSG